MESGLWIRGLRLHLPSDFLCFLCDTAFPAFPISPPFDYIGCTDAMSKSAQHVRFHAHHPSVHTAGEPSLLELVNQLGQVNAKQGELGILQALAEPDYRRKPGDQQGERMLFGKKAKKAG